MEAKAGDKITEKARKRLAMCMGGNYPIDAIPTAVEPKGAGQAGQWFCITCGDLPQNNMSAQIHADDHRTHRLAWRSFDSGKIEAP